MTKMMRFLTSPLILLLGSMLGATSVAAQTPPQPTGLQVHYRAGQTFLTWTERGDLAGEHYRIYRHSAPITAGNLASATRLYEVAEGSSRFWGNYYVNDTTGLWQPRYTERLVVDDLGTPVAAGTGVLVWTLAAQDFGGGSSGSGYYAVTTVNASGTENTADFSTGNTAGPLAEQVADPLPVEIAHSAANVGAGGHVFIQYMDLRNWNPTFHAPNPLNGFYGMDSGDPAVAGGICYAYDYPAYEPDLYCDTVPAHAPVLLILHGWNDNRYPPPAEIPDGYWCAWKIYPVDDMQTWYFGFAKSCDFRTGAEPAAGDTVGNFSERRFLRMVYDLLHHPTYGSRTDPDRVYIYGQSMGGSGTLSMALRYPEAFAAAYASEPMTNYRTSGDGGGVDWRGDVTPKWGSIALNLPVEIRAPGTWGSTVQPYSGTGVWDWQNHQANLSSRRADPMVPFGVAHGTADTVIEWSTQGRPFYAPLDGSLHGYGGGISDADHTWLSFLGMPPTLAPDMSLIPFYALTVIKGESVPGLSHASGNPALPPAAPGLYNGTIEWSSSWDAWDGAPVDTSSQWRMSLRTTDGSTQTLDVTPRRLQHFVLSPGSYAWENRRVSDDGLVAQGNVTVGSDGLATVTGFSVTPGGNRLLIRSGGGGCALACTATVPASGTVAIPVAFASTATPSGCSGSPTFDWDFGDGTAHSTSQNPSHTFASEGTFSWTLTVHIESQTCTRTGSITITGTPTCTLSCSATVPPSGNTGSPLAFAASASPSNCTGSVTYAWTFGDGSTSSEQNPSHTYASAGNFPWNLTATIQGVTCTRSGSITITTSGGARPWPDTSSSILVFNDQLSTWDMSDEQFAFAATHYAGCQKVTRDAARHLREINPNFLVLHYRLGQALGYRMPDGACHPTGDFLQIIDGNDWVQEWPGDSTVQAAWFFQYGGSPRVYSCTDGHYLMNLDDPGWRAWWSAQVIQQMQDNENDGLFADSYGVPNYFGPNNFDPHLPDIDPAFENAWAASEHAFTDYMQGRFAGQYKWLPNIGALINSRDPSDHSNIDGGMVENFAEWGMGDYFDEGDWVLEMNALLPLTAAGKIMILQTYPDGTNVQERLFCLGTYLLAKGSRTYVNLDTGEEPEWFPEYGADLGAATDPLPADIAMFLHPTWNLYVRHFANGMVLVNPSDSSRTADLNTTYNLLVPTGGGNVPSDGTAPGSLSTTPVTSTTIPAHGAAILLSTTPPPCTLSCTATVPANGTAGSPVAFASTATPTNCTGSVTYGWSFGDGATSAVQNPSHTYAAEGSYTWSLTASIQGVTCTQSGTITVSEVPVCVLTCTATVPATGTAGTPVAFASTATPTNCTGSVTYGWTFGDGATSTAQNPSHTYAAEDSFSWSLTASVQGITCFHSGTIVIHPPGTGLPGDCDGDGSVSIGEVQKAINMFLSTLAPGCGVDCNGDGVVSIGEVQKVINAFLGIPASC